MENKKVFIVLIIAYLVVACTQTNDMPTNHVARQETTSDLVQVDAQPVNYGTFYTEIIANGKLRALRKAGLYFDIREKISNIYVQNGKKVEKAQKIAELDTKELQLQYEKAVLQLQKAEVEMNDLLLGHTIRHKDTSNIPEVVLKNIRIKSGYNNAVLLVQQSELKLNSAVLYAPFAGVVANLTAKPYNIADTGNPFCSIIDNSTFEIEFYIMESELHKITEQKRVKVSPFINDSLVVYGKITEINPVVEDNGMIAVKAQIENKNKQLYEGMNVNISIQTAIGNVIYVPKNAIVRRQGKEVVFTYKSGRAKWNYVILGKENSSAFIIKSGLQKTDTIIISNNLNLAHDAIVKIEK